MKNEKVTMVEAPLMIVYEKDKKVITMLHPPANSRFEYYGIIIADVIRHTARCFNVSEDEVFEWVQKEMESSSTKIEGGIVQ